MLGYPGETEADIYDTVRYLKDASPDHFTITVAYPIKGTSLFQEVESTLSNDDKGWEQSTDRDRDFSVLIEGPIIITLSVGSHLRSGFTNWMPPPGMIQEDSNYDLKFSIRKWVCYGKE